MTAMMTIPETNFPLPARSNLNEQNGRLPVRSPRGPQLFSSSPESLHSDGVIWDGFVQSSTADDDWNRPG